MRRAVVGFGSPLGADRVGWVVVEKLPLLPDDEVLSLDRPGVALLDYIKDFDQVVLVDAMQGGNQPLRVISRNQLMEVASVSLSSHAAGVAEAVALGGALGVLPAQLDLVGVHIEVEQECVGDDQVDEAVAKVLELLQ